MIIPYVHMYIYIYIHLQQISQPAMLDSQRLNPQFPPISQRQYPRSWLNTHFQVHDQWLNLKNTSPLSWLISIFFNTISFSPHSYSIYIYVCICIYVCIYIPVTVRSCWLNPLQFPDEFPLFTMNLHIISIHYPKYS